MKVIVIKDLKPAWKGEIRLHVMKGQDCLSTRAVPCEVRGFGREIVTLPQVMPAEAGDYTLVAELSASAGSPVRSLRDFKVVPRSKTQ